MVDELPDEVSPVEVTSSVRIFQAMVTNADDTARAELVTVPAMDLTEARRLLEAEHGKGNIFGLHDPNDVQRMS